MGLHLHHENRFGKNEIEGERERVCVCVRERQREIVSFLIRFIIFSSDKPWRTQPSLIFKCQTFVTHY